MELFFDLSNTLIAAAGLGLSTIAFLKKTDVHEMQYIDVRVGS